MLLGEPSLAMFIPAQVPRTLAVSTTAGVEPQLRDLGLDGARGESLGCNVQRHGRAVARGGHYGDLGEPRVAVVGLDTARSVLALAYSCLGIDMASRPGIGCGRGAHLEMEHYSSTLVCVLARDF